MGDQPLPSAVNDRRMAWEHIAVARRLTALADVRSLQIVVNIRRGTRRTKRL